MVIESFTGCQESSLYETIELLMGHCADQVVSLPLLYGQSAAQIASTKTHDTVLLTQISYPLTCMNQAGGARCTRLRPVSS